MDNGTMVEALKYLNYCQLANCSFISKRFCDMIRAHGHKLALRYVDSMYMVIVHGCRKLQRPCKPLESFGVIERIAGCNFLLFPSCSLFTSDESSQGSRRIQPIADNNEWAQLGNSRKLQPAITPNDLQGHWSFLQP
ncbi:hypothetical protein DdX_19270 [Ditylenchus destructor]|uniref:F-box domain-containing protein n=1 Tax=Ditylenchus destructor TaxID=166010 RepID=A0AAD4MJ59_9BILA|nr:hypothetical protein DdX_19270 [Ditylenchus destructor]